MYRVTFYNSHALRDYLYHPVYIIKVHAHLRDISRDVCATGLYCYNTYDLCHVYIRRRVISKYAAGTLRICLYCICVCVCVCVCKWFIFLMKESSKVSAHLFYL